MEHCTFACMLCLCCRANEAAVKLLVWISVSYMLRCRSPPPASSAEHHRLLWMTVPLLWIVFFYLPSHECICLFTSHSHFYWYSCSRCNDTYPHPPSRPDSWFICSHGTVLLVTDWFSGRFVPTHPQPKALLCNHTKYVGNPFYFHT